MATPAHAAERAAARVAPGALLVLAGAFAIALLVAAPADAEFGYDLDAYLGAARRLVDGQPLYPQAGQAVTPGPRGAYFYPPTTALPFVPLSLLPVEVARLAWFGALIALAVVVGYGLLRDIEPSRRPVAAAAYLAFLPLLSELRFGNLNLVTLALCLLGWRLRDREALSGAVFAAAIGLKLLPLAVVPFLLASGRWRTVAWALAVTGLTVLLSWPWLGSRWLEYAGVLGGIGIGAPAAGSNIVPVVLTEPPFRYLLPLVALAAASLAGLAARGPADPGRQTASFDACLAAAPLLATSVWYTYLVLALPALVRRARDAGPAGRGPWRPLAWLALEARLAPLPLAGLVGLVAGALLELFRRPSGRPEAPG